MKKQFIILTISLCVLLISLNNYSIAQKTEEQKLTQEQIEAFRSAKTVRIIVEQSYGRAGNLNLPIKELVRGLLKYAELDSREPYADKYDIEVKIEARGLAQGGEYTRGGYLYTGAKVSGSISLEIPGIPVYKKSFFGSVNPPISVPDREIISYKSTSGAPFLQTFDQITSLKGKILEIMGEIYGIDCLIRGLKDESSNVSYFAMFTIENILKKKDSPPAVDPFIALLKDERRHTRSNAARCLGDIKDPSAVDPLIALLKDEEEDVRRAAAVALNKIGDPRAVEPLIFALKDENKFVRGNAATALGNIKDPRAVEPLIFALKDVVKWVRKDIAVALGNIKDPRAVEPLIFALKDEDEVVRQATANALKDITRKKFGENQEKWQKWWKKNKEKFLKKK